MRDKPQFVQCYMAGGFEEYKKFAAQQMEKWNSLYEVP